MNKGAEGGPRYYRAREERPGTRREQAGDSREGQAHGTACMQVQRQWGPRLLSPPCSCSRSPRASKHCSIQFTAHSAMAPVSGKLQAPKVPSPKKKKSLGFKTQATMDFPICLSCLTMLNPTAQVSRSSPSATTVLRIVVSSPVTPMTPQGCTGQIKAEV